MFEGLIDRFEKVKRKILGYGRITDKELAEFAQDLRLTLLEADVNYLVVKDFIGRVETRAQSLQLSRSLRPAEVLLKVVYDELIALLGDKAVTMTVPSGRLAIASLLGLQGTGKTTTAVKLAQHFKSRRPLLVAADTKRPAAREQLRSLAARTGLPVFETQENDPVKICIDAKEHATRKNHGLLIVDTAGRLHVDNDLVDELIAIDKGIAPDWKLIVVDGMTGQDAVNQTKEFNRRVGLSGAIVTKLDGDAKGGAALSVVAAASVPIFFIGVGEKIDALEEFHPDRIAGRILGMGDMKTLAEKVSDLGLQPSQESIKKIKKGEITLEDFRKQMQQVKKLGSLSQLAAMMPGVKAEEVDEKEMVRIEAIINSMTADERARPDIIDGSRKQRIAQGSGTTVQDVNQLLKQFIMARDMLKQMSKGQLPSTLRVEKKSRKVIRK